MPFFPVLEKNAWSQVNQRPKKPLVNCSFKANSKRRATAVLKHDSTMAFESFPDKFGEST